MLDCGGNHLYCEVLAEANPACRLSVTMLPEQNQAQQIPLSAGRKEKVRAGRWLRVPTGFRLLARSAAHSPLADTMGVDVPSQRCAEGLLLQVNAGWCAPESHKCPYDNVLGELYVLGD